MPSGLYSPGVTSLLRRLPICLLALLPVVWGNCPYWFVGSPGARDAKASREDGPRCPCCRKKAGSVPGRDSTNPYDCGDCPMIVARHGSAPAPAPTVLPDAHDAGAFVAVPALPPAGIDPTRVLEARGAAGPPTAPPGGVVSTLLDEVSLRI